MSRTSKLGNARQRAAARIRLIRCSELSAPSKLRYLLDMIVRRLWPGLRQGRRQGTRRYHLTGQRSIELRENSTDWKVFEEIFLDRVYDAHAAAAQSRLTRHGASPTILIDLGANIGLSVIALARALRPARIVAVEPDAANFRMLVRNLRSAGLSSQTIALNAFAGAEAGFAELVDSGYGAWGMRMGPAANSGVPILPIADIAVGAGLFPHGRDCRVILKCDIEGSERQLFECMPTWEDLVDFIILELHTEFLPASTLHACLADSGYAWRMVGEIPPGACLAVFGLERVREKRVMIGQSAG